MYFFSFSALKGDNSLAKVPGLSPLTGGQTMMAKQLRVHLSKAPEEYIMQTNGLYGC